MKIIAFIIDFTSIKKLSIEVSNKRIEGSSFSAFFHNSVIYLENFFNF